MLLVEQGEDSPLLYSDAAECELPSWVAGHAPVEPGERLECKVRLRHRQPLQDAYLALTDDGFRLDFAQKQRAVTPGTGGGRVCRRLLPGRRTDARGAVRRQSICSVRLFRQN